MWIDDVVINECDNRHFTNIFVPAETVVVLGRGNKEETECLVEACQKDGVKILKRYGGGGTVVLHGGCVVVSTGVWVDDPFKNEYFFEKINDAVIDTISSFSKKIPKVEQRGISDLAISGKKIAGTSLFRSKNYLLYQASILVDKNIDLISGYLKHPSKEPDYRKGKSHEDFLTDLKFFDNEISSEKLSNFFESHYRSNLEKKLGDHMTEPMKDHLKHLYKRASKNSD
jgi:lipoate-protein ligase A